MGSTWPCFSPLKIPSHGHPQPTWGPAWGLRRLNLSGQPGSRASCAIGVLLACPGPGEGTATGAGCWAGAPGATCLAEGRTSPSGSTARGFLEPVLGLLNPHQGRQPLGPSPRVLAEPPSAWEGGVVTLLTQMRKSVERV